MRVLVIVVFDVEHFVPDTVAWPMLSIGPRAVTTPTVETTSGTARLRGPYVRTT
jgi:hypothetical protein